MIDERYLSIARTLAVDAATAEVSSTFAAEGLSPIVLKGPTFAAWLYGPGERAYSDTDLLVAPSDFHRAEALLVELGFRRWAPGDDPLDRPRHAHTWVRHSDERVVDLHRTLIGVRSDEWTLWRALDRSTEAIYVSGARVRCLNVEARTFVLTLHAAQDGVRQGKPLEDLRRALDMNDGAIWCAAFDLAKELEAQEAFAAGLRMVEPGRELAAELGLPEPSAVDIRLRARGAPPLSLGIDWLLSLRGVRDRCLFVWRKLFPTVDYMRSWSPLASRGRLGLAGAYVARIGWMVLRLPSAYRAWRRATRS